MILKRISHVIAAFSMSVSCVATGSTGQDIRLPGARAYPESITSSSDGTLYVSNIAQGGILRIQNNKKPEMWIRPGYAGLGSTYGMAIDKRAGIFWVCSNDLSSMGLAKSDGSAVMGFDLVSGAKRRRIQLPDGPAECNDIAIGKDGTLYVTDSGKPRVLRLRPGEKAFSILSSDERFGEPGGGPDGIAIGADGNLYINILGTGCIFRIPLTAKSAGTPVEIRLSQILSGTDGMRHEGGNRFLVVTGEGTLMRVAIVGDQGKVGTVASGLHGPTGLTIRGDRALIAEGYFEYLFDEKMKGKKPPLPFYIRARPLNPNAR